MLNVRPSIKENPSAELPVMPVILSSVSQLYSYFHLNIVF